MERNPASDVYCRDPALCSFNAHSTRRLKISIIDIVFYFLVKLPLLRPKLLRLFRDMLSPALGICSSLREGLCRSGEAWAALGAEKLRYVTRYCRSRLRSRRVEEWLRLDELQPRPFHLLVQRGCGRILRKRQPPLGPHRVRARRAGSSPGVHAPSRFARCTAFFPVGAERCDRCTFSSDSRVLAD